MHLYHLHKKVGCALHCFIEILPVCKKKNASYFGQCSGFRGPCSSVLLSLSKLYIYLQCFECLGVQGLVLNIFIS